MKRLFVAAAVAVLMLSAPASDVAAWGATGHRLIAVAAMRALPEELPAFLRDPSAVAAVGELAREPDRWKGGPRVHARGRDTAHFIDFDDSGHVLTPDGPHIDALPELRSQYEQALTRAGLDVNDAGWLPYALVDGWHQLTRDFAYWRVLRAAEARETDAGRRAWYGEDRRRREALILRDLGVWAHYVGDASQPMHVSIHYNGWGDHPNPEGFTTSRQTHALFEGQFVRRHVALPALEAAMPAPVDCHCPIERRTAIYLGRTLDQVVPFYRLEKAGGFAEGDPRGVDFAVARLAAAAGELRDLTVLAWAYSGELRVGWPAVAVADVEAGRVDPWDSLIGLD